MFIFFLVAFAMGFHFAFGSYVLGYHTLTDSIVNIFYMVSAQNVAGEEHLTDVSWATSTTLILIVSVLLSVILMNIFIAVVSEIYSNTTKEAVVQFEHLMDDAVVWELDGLKLDLHHDLTVGKAIKKTIRRVTSETIERTREIEEKKKKLTFSNDNGLGDPVVHNNIWNGGTVSVFNFFRIFFV
jgi:hypothetical protein